MAKPAAKEVPNFIDTPLSHVKQEQQSPPPQPQQQQGEAIMDVKAELMEIPILDFQITPFDQEQQQPHFIKSIDELAALATAINTFKRCFDDLQDHVASIQTSIDAKLAGASSSTSPPPAISAPTAIVAQETGNSETEAEKKPEMESKLKPEPQRLCESMCGRGLRRYVSANLSDSAKLREEIPEALKLAKKPAKLVLDCIGRFYLQGSKAYIHNSPMIPARKVSVLVLEYFILMVGDVEIEREVRTEAETAAVAWKKRMINEGGLRKAEEMDARGLLLLIAGFGIPPGFKNEDLMELIRLSNPVEISDALRRSAVLVPRVPGIIEGMIKRGLHVDAVEFTYIFGLEDKFSPQTTLTSFLRMNKEAFERAKRKANFSPVALKEANEKQLAALKSVVGCLDNRKIDSAKFLPGWQIKDQMVKLEKDINDLSKEIEDARSKRRMEEITFSNRLNNQEIKRARFASRESPLVTSATYTHTIHDQRFSSVADGNDISILVNSYLNPPSSIPHGPDVASSSQNITATGLGSGVSAYVAGSGYVSNGSYPGIHSETGWQQSYASQPTPSFGLQSVYGQSHSAEGFRVLQDYSPIRSTPSDLYKFADAV